MHKRYKIIVFAAFLFTLHLQAGEDALNRLINDERNQYANISLLVKNMKTGEVLADYRSNNVVPPASTMKLITTATALELLGSDYQYETYLETDGEIRNGVLNGNLYIRGTGDPTLGSHKVGNQQFLCKWVQGLRQAGITKIEGKVIADVSYFDATATNPAWLNEDIGNYYAPGIFALSYLDNTMNILLSSTAVGDVAEVVRTIPEVEGMSFENHVRCTKTQYDGAYVSGMPYHNFRLLVGTVPANQGMFGIKGDLPNPPYLLAKHFIEKLKEQGIEVTKDADYQVEPILNSDGSKQTRKVLYTYKSEPLSEIIRETNENSNNMYAEMIFRALGSKVATPATIDYSIDMVRRFWQNRKISLDGCWIYDGCGLAPQDAISTKVFVQLLDYMAKSAEREAFYNSLPVSGTTGTLRSFCAKTKLEGKVHAKSGTLSRVKSYAGYIEVGNDETWEFAIIINNANCKVRVAQTMIENFLVGLYEERATSR